MDSKYKNLNQAVKYSETHQLVSSDKSRVGRFSTVQKGKFEMTSRQDQASHIIRKYHHARFLICNSCLWCASWLDGDNSIQICPTCRSEKLELTPISETEAYRMNIDGGGISMEFWNP